MNEKLAHKSDFDKLHNRIHEFTRLEHVDQLRTVWLPHFDDFSTKIYKFINKFNELEEVVKQFDVNLSLKSNKT